MVKKFLSEGLLWCVARGANKLAESGVAACSLALRRARLIRQKGYCLSLDPAQF